MLHSIPLNHPKRAIKNSYLLVHFCTEFCFSEGHDNFRQAIAINPQGITYHFITLIRENLVCFNFALIYAYKRSPAIITLSGPENYFVNIHYVAINSKLQYLPGYLRFSTLNHSNSLPTGKDCFLNSPLKLGENKNIPFINPPFI